MAKTLTNSQATKQNKWLRLAILVAILIALSFGLAYLFQKLLSPVVPMLSSFAWLAYLGVFSIMLLSNMTLIAPVPVTTAMMISVATRFDPTLVAFFASLGGTLGELSGYFAGYLGKKIALNEATEGYHTIQGWMNRYGLWTIAFLAFQPILPFDVAGFIAGASKMPIWKFLPALWLGKFPKYLLLSYFGAGLTNLLPW